MRKRDLEKFRKLLNAQRDQLMGNVRKAMTGDIHLDPDDFPDEIDTASSEMNLAFMGRLRERERGLLGKIEGALAKIDEGVYGQCQNCGEEIGKNDPFTLTAFFFKELHSIGVMQGIEKLL